MHALPLGPRPPTTEAPPTPAGVLARSLLLAVLLHVWLLLWVGNVPGGSAAPGQGVWGAIDVRLGSAQGVAAERGQVPMPPQLPGPQGRAERSRFGGQVRPDPAPVAADSPPGAARLGNWQALSAPPLRARDELAAMAAAADLPAVPALTTPWATLAPAAPEAPAPAPAPAPGPEAAPTPTPTPTTATLSSLPASPARPPAANLAAPPAEVLQALPRSLPALDAVPPSEGRLAAPLPGLAAPGSALPLPEALPLPATLPQQPPEGLADLAPLAEMTRLRTLPTPTPAAAPVPGIPRPDSSLQALPQPLPALATPSADLQPVPGPGPDALGAGSASGRAAGAPDAGPWTGRDVATPPSAAASQSRLNLSLPPLRGGALSSAATPGVLQLLPRPPEQPSKLAQDIEQAGREDCRKAYGGGLLAAVPLVRDAVTGKGCKW